MICAVCKKDEPDDFSFYIHSEHYEPHEEEGDGNHDFEGTIGPLSLDAPRYDPSDVDMAPEQAQKYGWPF